VRWPKKKVCAFCKDKVTSVGYKDANLLRKCISDHGTIRARRLTSSPHPDLVPPRPTGFVDLSARREGPYLKPL
jgi:hypothetical protein